MTYGKSKIKLSCMEKSIIVFEYGKVGPGSCFECKRNILFVFIVYKNH